MLVVVSCNFICFVIVFYLFLFCCLSCFLLYLNMFVFCLFYVFDDFGVKKIIDEGDLYCVSWLLLMYLICYFGFLFLIWLCCYFILWIVYILNFVCIFNFMCFCLIISGDVSLNFGLFIMFFIINCWVV